ncbi:hypothetical protein Cgig2_006249 [Carnegiea gigantea]|uniref:Uncharacterized protein n=1 Tax=Carnegiea gigantea TaxID=171969 RepID=A0A9Q1GUY5_9CARY|nr:hypothetical protein Cgig2_006249 [Carnegiea gigantea]
MGLPEEDSKFLISIRSTVLPVRVWAELILEPYYPNRFSRQFGFDKGVLSNRSNFIKALRQQRSMMDLEQAHADLQRWDTGAKFYVPPSHYEGVTIVPGRDLQYHPLKKEKPRELLAGRLSSKIEEIFGIVETAIKTKDLVDIDRLNNLYSEASKLKIKEKEVLLEAEGELKFSLDLKKKEAEQVKADLAKAGFSKLQDLEKEKNHLKSLIGSVISFKNV